MAHFALQTLLYRGREYAPGEKVPVTDEHAEDLVDRELVEKGSKPSVDAEAVAEATDDDTVAPDYSRENKDTLVAIANERGLELAGNATKADIVEALEADDEPA